MGDKFTSSLSDAGELILTIYDFSWAEVGEYKVQIDNDYGSASRLIKMDMSGTEKILVFSFSNFFVFSEKKNYKLNLNIYFLL